MTRAIPIALVVAILALVATACGDDDPTPDASQPTGTTAPAATEATTTAADNATPSVTSGDSSAAELRTFTFEAWSDNWFAAYVNGELIGEDSVPITTERSFNSETFTFEAAPPFTLAVVTKDFIEDDSGLEYIGTDRQQMGDGGFIAQLIDADTGSVIAGSDASWVGLVIHAAPLNKDCEKADDPTSACQSEISEEPAGWQLADFDDATWSPAIVYSEGDVGPKDGYDEIDWDASAELIWSSDLETDNTILWRVTIQG